MNSVLRRWMRWLRSTTGLLVVAASGLGVLGVLLDSDVLLVAAIAAAAVTVAAIGAHSSGNAASVSRAHVAIEALGSDGRRVGRDLNELKAHADETAAAAVAARRDLGARVEAMSARFDGVAHRIDDGNGKIVGRLRDLEVRVTELDRSVSRRLAEERSARSLVLARRSAAPPLDRVVVLMTIHRSGSTRLYDLVRSHPAVVLDPTMRTWDQLGWAGRRYPSALCDRVDGVVPIEVEHGVGAVVPASAGLEAHVTEPWIVEKGHPQFVDFDARRFADGIERLRDDGVRVEVVYGTRDPLAAMWSMHTYKLRDPKWYAFLDPADIPDWIDRSLATMVEMRALVDGLVVDYADHHHPDLRAALAARLSPAWSADELDGWSARVEAALDPARRSEAGGVFVGDGSSGAHDDGPDGIWSDRGASIEAARAAHRALLQG